MDKSYEKFTTVGIALDPIHVGTGGSRIGLVDLTIVRDPVTQVPKIPGSSLAGVYRAYVAMAEGKYPKCAGLGASGKGGEGHCGNPDCPVCTVFGFAKGKGEGGGFAGLAGFTDARVLLFPVATRQGPLWITCPDALRALDDLKEQLEQLKDKLKENNTVCLLREAPKNNKLNLGWLFLDVEKSDGIDNLLKDKNIPDHILNHIGIVSDSLFPHIVNSNLEIRTSVSINPATGAAETGALFSYEALPRATVLVWDIIARNPKHFKIGGKKIKPENTEDIYKVLEKAHPYLEHLGIGGMTTRGMGRVKVVFPSPNEEHQNDKGGSQNDG